MLAGVPGGPATGSTLRPVCRSQRPHFVQVNLGSVAYSEGTGVLQPGQRDGSVCSGGRVKSVDRSYLCTCDGGSCSQRGIAICCQIAPGSGAVPWGKRTCSASPQ